MAFSITVFGRAWNFFALKFQLNIIMKRIFIYLTILFSIVFMSDKQAIAQSVQHKLYGIIADSATRGPLGFATLNLRNVKDSLIKNTISTADGAFTLEHLQGMKYHLIITSTGYEEKVVDADVANPSNINLGTIYLSKKVKTLKEVIITANKPIVQQKADRIVYDMQADPESKVNNVLGMIHKIPYLTIDADDNVQMKGNNSFKVLINGKPSSMLTNNLKEVLRTMPASSVVRIEVITIPPSKYDAEGLAGIINIITNKKVNNGYKGNLNISDRFPSGGPDIGGGFTLQQGKLGVNSYLGAGTHTQPQTTNSINRTTIDTNITTALKQSGYGKENGKNGYFGTEISYEIDSLNLLSGNFNINGSRYNNSSYQTSLLSGNAGLIQGYNVGNNSYGDGNGFDAAVNYQLGFTKDKNTLLTFSYQYSDYTDNSNNDIDISNPFDYSTPDYKQYNQQSSREQTIQVDYTHPINKVNMEAGIKAILRNSKSNSLYNSLDSATHIFEPEPDMNNLFNYTQNVFGAYNSYQFSIKTWSFSAGLRAEGTHVNANFISTASNSVQNYLNVVPSLAINKSFKNNSSISFGFVQRLRRPSIYRLNPFVDRSDPNFVSTGNPNLRAVTMNIVQMGYNYNGKTVSVFIGTDYTFVNNLDLQVTKYDPATHITTAMFENTGKGGGQELNFNLNYSPCKFYNLSVNTYALYLMINGTGSDSTSKLNRLLGHVSVSNGFKFERGWSINVNADYNSRNPNSLQGSTNGYFTTSLSVNKELVKNKLYFSAAVNNPFTKFRYSNSETSGPDFVQTNVNQLYFRSVYFSLNYNFGRLNSDIKKNRKGIDNDDVSNNKGGGL